MTMTRVGGASGWSCSHHASTTVPTASAACAIRDINGLLRTTRASCPEVEDPLMRQIRYLDKLVDELAKGRPLEKILRA